MKTRLYLTLYLIILMTILIMCSLEESNLQIQSRVNTQKKSRWTQDGRMCARAFVQDGETYFDCTKSRSPDGVMGGKEWCYVENPQTGSKTWDFCKPIMDYDQVRKYNQKGQHEMTLKVNLLNKNLQQNIRPAQETLTQLNKLKSGQENLSKKISNMFKSLENINKNLAKLFKTKNSWDSQIELIKELEFKIEKIKESKKEATDKENESNSQGDDISSKISAHEAILGTKKAKTNYCKGMMNYEDEEEGDGLVGKYYNNEVWIGSYIERKDPDIDFDWTGASPMNKINPNNFSIVWDGFLYVPYSGSYYFVIKADDGVELTVNNQILLRKKMSMSLDQDESTKDIGTPFKMDLEKISSEYISLQGGTKVKITIKYFHSIHNDLDEDGQVLMKLFWASSEFQETILPNKYLYSSNDFPPLKVTGFSSNEAVLSKLYENDVSFKNSDRYIIQDIPLEFLSATSLKYDTLFKKDDISFHINTPSIVYIGLISHYPNPLPHVFENTGMVISLLEIDKTGKNNGKKIIAKSSATLQIYKHRYGMGEATIKLNKYGINKSGVPFILFFGFDSKANAPLSCLGKTMLLSVSSSNTFKKCSASSEKSGMKCEAGFSGIMRDEEGGIWSTMNEGIGAWIEIQFKGLFEIRKFEFKNKKNPSERNKSLELLFSDGRTQRINLKNTDDLLNFKVEPVRTTSIKITIRDVYGVINNGGSFKFYGVECLEVGGNSDSTNNYLPDIPEFLPLKSVIKNKGFSPLFEREYKKPISLNCRDSITNSHKFESVNTLAGNKIIISCPESCATTDVPVYGGANSNYTIDSAICKSAFHSGKITSSGGVVTMVIKNGDKNYKGSYKNGFKSEGKPYSSISIKFEPFMQEDPIILKDGTKVDINLEGSEFKRGTIREVIMLENKKVSLKVQIEGGLIQIMPYPNSKVRPCGSHFRERDCTGSVKHYISKFPVKIRFINKSYPTTGDYLPDYGDIYGATGKPFGFSRSMVEKVISLGTASKPELETHVKFPPSPLSRYCNKPNPDSNCEPVVWSVWSGTGKFRVKLFIGDPRNEVHADFAINGKSVCRSRKISKNKLEIIDAVVESKGGFINITSECTENCDKALSKLNAVEISPFDNGSSESSEDSVKKEKKLECGDTYIKGRCDKGPDVGHCLFDDKTNPTAAYCSGSNALMTIPNDYKCKDQVGKYKCVKIEYESEHDCKKYCPKPCKATKCLY
jgi:hypothetical protein